MKVILVTLHHRRSLFYEASMQKLLDKDYKLVILETGVNKGFGVCNLTKNVSYHFTDTPVSYDQGMMLLPGILEQYDWDIVVFVDNDLFIFDTDYFEKRIKDFIEDEYNFSSYFENGFSTEGLDFKNTIAEVKNQTFDSVSVYPGFKPNPHWENAFMMFRRQLWDNLTTNDISHSRKMVKAIHSSGAKMGAIQKEECLTYSHAGKGWFHVGNLMGYYYKVEDLNTAGFDFNSELDMSRLGYFLAQRNVFGREIYTKEINTFLDAMPIEKGLEAWKKLVKGYEYFC